MVPRYHSGCLPHEDVIILGEQAEVAEVAEAAEAAEAEEMMDP